MSRPRSQNWKPTLGLAICLVLCGCVLSPVPSPRAAVGLLAQPTSTLDDVHVIFVESILDFGHLGRLDDVCLSMRQHGVNAVYFNPIEDGNGCDLFDYVQGVRAENPNARIMLVGWSFGAIHVKHALEHFEDCGEPIDTVVYIDSAFLKLSEFTGHPDGADRVVLVYRSLLTPMPLISDSEVLCVDTLWHRGITRHPCVIDRLYAEAARLAGYEDL